VLARHQNKSFTQIERNSSPCLNPFFRK
jgi:hypothetical protein